MSQLVKRKVAYVASPYAKYFNNGGAKLAVDYARKVSNFARIFDYTPISPVMAFDGIFDDTQEREIALQAGFDILEKCDVFFYIEEDLEESQGMREELELAKKYGLEIVCKRSQAIIR